jgi:hypothetical protein
MKKPAVLVGLSVGMLIGGICWYAGQAPSHRATDPRETEADAYSTVPERVFDDDFRPTPIMAEQPLVLDLARLSTAEADRLLKPEEPVLGVVHGGEARAYPINVLNNENRRKTLNDTLAGLPLVVTWCDRCQTAIAYSRRVDDRVLTFQVSGYLWNETMVMKDQQTHTLWSFLLGEAKNGPLKGTRLTQLAATQTDWKTWRHEQPAGTVAWLEPSKAVIRSPYSTDSIIAHPESMLLVGQLGGEAKSWKLDALAHAILTSDSIASEPVLIVAQGESATYRCFSCLVNGRTLTFERDGARMVDMETGTKWELLSGHAVSGPMAGTELTPIPTLLVDRSIWQQIHTGQGR